MSLQEPPIHSITKDFTFLKMDVKEELTQIKGRNLLEINFLCLKLISFAPPFFCLLCSVSSLVLHMKGKEICGFGINVEFKGEYIIE